MPKKKKSPQVDPHEGRPQGLTLGDFLSSKITQSQRRAEEACSSSNNDIKEEVNNLDGITKEEGCDDVHINLPNVEVEENATPANTLYFVCRTKKGGIPVKVENRSSGKKVTLVEHVKGDGKMLVHDMKMKFGTGGLFKDGTIELQGDCKLKVTKYLNENKSLLKPYNSN